MAKNLKTTVLKVDVHNEKDMTKAIKMVSGIVGVRSIEISTKENELTVTGAADLEEIAYRLGKKAKVAPPLYHYGRYVTREFG